MAEDTGYVRGVPQVVGPGPDTPCPNCGCRRIFRIEVSVEMPGVRGNNGFGVYIGCPACPWASRMACYHVPEIPL